MRTFLAALSTLTLCLGAARLPAQSLGDLANREKEKRKAKPAKVYTEDDLQRAGGPARNASPATQDDSAAKAGATTKDTKEAPPAGTVKEKEKTPEEIRADEEKAWRDRRDKATAEVARLSAEVSRLQDGVSDPTLGQYGPRRASALEEVDKAKQELAKAQQAVTDLEEERRRSGYRQ